MIQMQVFNLLSDHSDVPLASIRSVGGMFDIVVDNTDGKIMRLAGNSFQKLSDLVSRSSHLRLEPSNEPMPHVLRYLLNNGDVIEITSDGKTALVNGELLDEDEKAELFEAVKSGALAVDDKPTDAMPAQPVMPISEPKPVEPPQAGLNPAIMSKMRQQSEQRAQERERSNANYDESIENANYNTENPEYTKALAYNLKYGLRKG